MRASFLLRYGPVVAVFFVVIGVAVRIHADDERWIDLLAGDLDLWAPPTGEWFIAGNAVMDPDNPKMLTAKPGNSVLVNGPKGRTRNLISKQKFGDIETHIEFLIPKRSNSGVKFEGLYEIQILDSYGVQTPKATDCGGIYPRAELKPTYHYLDDGVPPRVNAARPAGEWQTLDVVFQAPRFDAAGKKIGNARFVKVMLNGQLIHENVEVRTPTGNAWQDNEMPTGPLLLQADHGPVAFRNVRVRPIP
jgi:Domain of Unknown Function (DUF1080)